MTTLLMSSNDATRPAPRRVLVVDDNALNRKLAATMLARAVYVVATVEDASSALAALEQAHVDVVLSDVSMPGLDGRELARRLRADARFKRLRVVAYTALAMEHQRAEILGAGFDDIALKPVTREALVQAIEGRPLP